MRKAHVVLPAALVAVDLGLAFGVPLAPGVLGTASAAIVAHAGIAAAYGVAMRILALSGGSDVTWLFGALAGLLAFFVPVLGSGGFLIAVVTLMTAKRKVEVLPFARYAPPSVFVVAPLEQLRPRLVHDRLVHLVRWGKELDTRFKAVLATTHAPPVVAVPVLKAALADAAEEVRLSAFSQLERTRRAIEMRIERRREGLKDEGIGEGRKAATHTALAQDYFEIAYLGLAEGEVYKHTLRAAEEQVRLALQLTPTNAALLHLLARLDMRQGRLDAARENLGAALAAGMPAGELAADRAEIAFRDRNWREVGDLLRGLADVAHDHVVLARVQEFWQWR